VRVKDSEVETDIQAVLARILTVARTPPPTIAMSASGASI